MSSKHLRRMLEEQQQKKEDEMITKTGGDNKEEDVDEEEEFVSRKPAVNKFAFFEESDGDGAESNDDAAEEKSDENITQKEKTVEKSDKKKEKNKKKKNKKIVGVDEPADVADMIDNLNVQSPSGRSMYVSMDELFKVDPRLFDASAELKKAIGKAFKEPTRHAGDHRTRRTAGRIVKEKHNWPPVKNIGLSMKPAKEEGDIKWFTFEHSTYYEGLDRMSWMGEEAMNHGVLEEILQKYPYHLSSLMLMANMFLMQEDVTQSVNLTEMGIFHCEQMFHSLFQPTAWSHRIDYNAYENRAFYLLLHRHMLNIIHKRCFETGFNVAKLIFKLDSDGDPLAMRLIVDTIAIKARQYRWVKSYYETVEICWGLNLLPNACFSHALAHFLSAETEEQVNEADELLKSAIACYPGVVRTLLDHLQIEADKDIENNSFFTPAALARLPEGYQLILKIYVNQSSELWKVPETLQWLERCTRAVATSSDDSKMKESQEKCGRIYTGMPRNVLRLAILLGLKPSKTAVTDPNPPPQATGRYARNMPRPLRVADDGVFLAFLNSLAPDYDGVRTMGDRMRELMDSLPNPRQILDSVVSLRNYMMSYAVQDQVEFAEDRDQVRERLQQMEQELELLHDEQEDEEEHGNEDNRQNRHLQ